jgi:hypothetical protein
LLHLFPFWTGRDTCLQAEIAAAVAEAETERLRAAQRDAKRAAAAAASAVPSSAPQLSKTSSVDASASALSKLKLQEKEAADRSAGESLLLLRFEPDHATLCPNVFLTRSPQRKKK